MSLRRYFQLLTNPQIRQRIAPLVLVGGGAVLWASTQDHLPHPQEVSVVLPAPTERAQIRAVRLTYTRDGTAMGGVTHSFEAGAPAEFRHSISLARGQYELSVALENADGRVDSFERTLTVPTDDVARIRLVERAP